MKDAATPTRTASVKAARQIILAVLFCFWCGASQAATITVNDLGDNGPGDCSSSCTLRDAVAAAAEGDTIIFAPIVPPPWRIALSGNELFIYKSVSIIGPGPDELVIDAQRVSRIVEVALNAGVAIVGAHFTNGVVRGAVGTDATPTSAATPGSPANGGAFLVNAGASLTLEESVIDENLVWGGLGGSIGNDGSQAGAGGSASGGAIYNLGFLKISRASIVENAALGGTGGGDELFPSTTSSPGDGGDASGGAIAGPGQVELTNVIMADNVSSGGDGGVAYFLLTNIPGGNGGNGFGGAIDAGGIVVLQFVTMTQNIVTAGRPGVGFINGSVGTSAGSDVFASSTVLSRSSIIASDGGSCGASSGSIALQGVNFNSDGTCPGFAVAPNLIKPITEVRNGYWIFSPAYKSPVIGAALDCDDAFGNQVETDVEGVSRPQGANCDVGAVESDYLFVDGFGG